MVVDDDEEVLETTQLILELGGYDVEPLADASMVFERIADFNPKLILLDIVLGKIDGRELCSQIKTHVDTKHIPILMMSGLYSGEEMATLPCAPDDYLTKPFKMDILLDKISKLISNKKASSELGLN